MRYLQNMLDVWGLTNHVSTAILFTRSCQSKWSRVKLGMTLQCWMKLSFIILCQNYWRVVIIILFLEMDHDLWFITYSWQTPLTSVATLPERSRLDSLQWDLWTAIMAPWEGWNHNPGLMEFISAIVGSMVWHCINTNKCFLFSSSRPWVIGTMTRLRIFDRQLK